MNTHDRPVDWMISWFERAGHAFVGEMRLPVRDEQQLRDILQVAPGSPLVGEMLIEQVHGPAIENLSGLQLDLSRYDYFVGAAEKA